MQRPRVLVAEDRPSVLRLMSTVLESAYEVVTAGSGEVALAMIGSVPLDAVVTDIRMPDASGFDVLRAVKDRSPRTEVVMMTAYANVSDAVSAIKLGAFDYVAKPIDADEISLVVARALESRGQVRGGTRHGGRGSGAPPPRAEGEHAAEVTEGFHQAIAEARERASRDYLDGLMRHSEGNVTHAAQWAGMTRESLHRVLRKYGVRSEDYKHESPGDLERMR